MYSLPVQHDDAAGAPIDQHPTRSCLRLTCCEAARETMGKYNSACAHRGTVGCVGDRPNPVLGEEGVTQNGMARVFFFGRRIYGHAGIGRCGRGARVGNYQWMLWVPCLVNVGVFWLR